MSDLELSGGFNWSGIRSGMEQMRSFVNQTTAGVQKDVAGMFTPGSLAKNIGFAVLAEQLASVVEKAHEIHHESERFGIDAEQLQLIANAAKEDGISLDQVARMMNLVEINAHKAAGGTGAEADALNQLGINAQEFLGMSVAEKVFAIADAYKASAKTGEDYAAVAQLIGKRNTELLPTLAKGSEAIKNSSKDIAVWSQGQIDALEKLHHTWIVIWESIKGVLGAAVAIIVNGFRTIMVAGEVTGQGLVEIFSTMTAGIGKGLKGDFAGAAQTMKDGFAHLKQEAAQGRADVEEVWAGKKGGESSGGSNEPGSPSTLNAQPSTSSGSGSGGAGSDDAEIKKHESALKEIAKLDEEHFARKLSDQEQLNALAEKSIVLYHALADTVGDQAKQDQAQIEYKKNQAEMDKLVDKIAQDQLDTEDKIAQKRQDAEESAQRDLSISQEANREFALRLKGEDAAADRAKIAFDYDTKIKEARDAITAAEKLGSAEAVKTNQALVEQLGLEKQNALAADAKAKAEASAAAAAEDHAQALQLAKSVDRAKDNLAGLQEQRAEQEQIAAGQVDIAENMHEQFEWQAKINEAADIANENWQKMDQAYSEGKTLLGDQYAALAKINEATVKELDLQRQIYEQEKQQALNEKAVHEQTENFFKANAAGVRGVGVGGIGTSGANAEDVATIVRPGDARAAAIAQAQDMISFITGKPVGFFEQLRRDNTLRNFANEQSAAGLKQGQLVPQQELQLWQQQLSWLSAGGQLQQAPASSSAAPSGELQTQITLLQQQLQQLVALNSSLRAEVGAH